MKTKDIDAIKFRETEEADEQAALESAMSGKKNKEAEALERIYNKKFGKDIKPKPLEL